MLPALFQYTFVHSIERFILGKFFSLSMLFAFLSSIESQRWNLSCNIDDHKMNISTLRHFESSQKKSFYAQMVEFCQAMHFPTKKNWIQFHKTVNKYVHLYSIGSYFMSRNWLLSQSDMKFAVSQFKRFLIVFECFAISTIYLRQSYDEITAIVIHRSDHATQHDTCAWGKFMRMKQKRETKRKILGKPFFGDFFCHMLFFIYN